MGAVDEQRENKINEEFMNPHKRRKEKGDNNKVLP
jgi:hypothetical protein